MPTRDFRSSNERRAYYRLLRYLLSEEVKTCYKEEQEEPLPEHMVDLLKTLENVESSKRH